MERVRNNQASSSEIQVGHGATVEGNSIHNFFTQFSEVKF